MANAIVTVPASTEKLAAARLAVANVARDTEKKTGEVIATYAAAMNETFNVTDGKGGIVAAWYELKGKNKAPVKAEREAFAALFVERGFDTATIDVYWSRVKRASGKPAGAPRVSGASDPAGACLADLKTMINRIFKMEEEGSESPWSDEKAVLMDVYGRMGGDVEKLG